MQRIYQTLLSDHFARNRQMAFLSGPRQVGKTTLAQQALPGAAFFSYDNPSAAHAIAAGPDRVAELAGLADPLRARNGVLFDELHKFPRWKSFLKGFFDVHGDGLPVAVTGSARLDVYKRGGDSLMGRYFPYRIHPLTVGELAGTAIDLETEFRPPQPVPAGALGALLQYGGFPEPFLKGERRFWNRWKRLRLEQLFFEDLRDLSRVQDLRGLRTLAELLAPRVGSGLNMADLAADLSVSPDTVKTWLGILESVYWCFPVRPWFRNVASSIRKQPKYYLWDWSLAPEGGPRAENLVASHLLKAVHWWTDTGLGDYSLHYLRTKQGLEVDFLVAKDNVPFLLAECKTSPRAALSPALLRFQALFSVPYAFQVALDAPASELDPRTLRNRPSLVSASDFFKVLP